MTARIPVQRKEIDTVERPAHETFEVPGETPYESVKVWDCASNEWLDARNISWTSDGKLEFAGTRSYEGPLIVCEAVPVDEHETETDTPIEPHDGLNVPAMVERTMRSIRFLEEKEDLNEFEKQKKARLEKRLEVVSGGT